MHCNSNNGQVSSCWTEPPQTTTTHAGIIIKTTTEGVWKAKKKRSKTERGRKEKAAANFGGELQLGGREQHWVHFPFFF